MSYIKPFIHLFKTLGKHYVFDVNTAAILPVEKEIYIFLEHLLAGKGDHPSTPHILTGAELQKVQGWIKETQEQGFLSSKRIKKIQHYKTPLVDFFLNHYMGNLILQVTQACNLRCKYCAYSGDYKNRSHNELMMSEEIAKKAIDYFIARSSEVPRLAFGFYGGEPFLNFNLIKILAKYIKQKAQGKECLFNITTNGTIMNEEIIQFLVNYEVNLFISLDGPKEVHDRNRCFGSGKGSYDVVMNNMELVRKIAPEYVNKKVGFSAVLNTDISFCSYSKFFTNYEEVKDQMFIASIRNPYSMKEDKKPHDNGADLQFNDDIEYETFKYMLYRGGRIEKQDVSKVVSIWERTDLLDIAEKRVLGTEVPDIFHPSGPCIPGSARLFVNASGDLYPCERVSETSKACKFGSINSGIDIEKAKEFMNIGCLTENECKNCWAARYCGACIACADNGEKLDKKEKLSYCKMFKDNAEMKLRKYCTYKEFGISTEKHFS